jgi:hypothetical protein
VFDVHRTEKKNVFIDDEICSCDVGLFWCSLNVLAVFRFGIDKENRDRGMLNAK